MSVCARQAPPLPPPRGAITHAGDKDMGGQILRNIVMMLASALVILLLFLPAPLARATRPADLTRVWVCSARSLSSIARAPGCSALSLRPGHVESSVFAKTAG